jgi:hypothetical protein
MLNPLSSPTYYARLQFTDARSCMDWIESVPLADTANAHEMLAAQIGLLTRTELSALERLRILEVLYPPATHLQSELARRYIGRALPLSIVEYSLWNSVLELWQALFAGYSVCFQLCSSADSALAPQTPLVALRCIDLTGAQIREHHSVYREIPPALWAQLNECYAHAERCGLATATVADPLCSEAPVRTTASAYGRVLLAQLANPYTLSARQMSIMYRWTGLWDTLIGIDPSPPAPGVTSVLAIDLSAAKPSAPASLVTAAPSVRYLSLDALGQALRRTLTRLREGHTPASLGLGADCRLPATERLLTLLYIHWCGAGIGHRSGVHERLEDARACVGLAAVLRQLESESEAFRTSTRAIRTAYGPFTEQWQVLGVSTPALVSVTRGPECDERIQHHQLVALKRRSDPGFRLGVTQWLKLEADGELSIGVRCWHGAPHFVRVKVADDDEIVELSALALPAVPEQGLQETLVLEPGVFRPGLRVEFASGAPLKARLTRLTERGADFERSAFELTQ